MSRPQDERALAIGVDVGGTWLRVVAVSVDDGRVRARARARTASAGGVTKFLRATYRTHRWTPRQVHGLVIAARGVWTQAERRGIASRARGLARRVQAISDVEAAFVGALGPERAGVLLLAGTGSIALGRTSDGEWVRAGGLGPLLGDEGSGFWIGREWLKRHLPLERARSLSRGPDAVPRIAALARGVIARARRGARAERELVRAAQQHLALAVAQVAERIGAVGLVDASWAGSLLGDAWFRSGVSRALAREGVRVRWRAPATDAALAAARLAARG